MSVALSILEMMINYLTPWKWIGIFIHFPMRILSNFHCQKMVLWWKRWSLLPLWRFLNIHSNEKKITSCYADIITLFMADQAFSFVAYGQRNSNGCACKLRCSKTHIILCYFSVHRYAWCSKSSQHDAILVITCVQHCISFYRLTINCTLCSCSKIHNTSHQPYYPTFINNKRRNENFFIRWQAHQTKKQPFQR